ncbi:MAG: type II secretion system F family protein [Clostridia bacterium]|nr:type II secretion system F family protein [Clostridia bacterium]MDD4146136.1 type II secretion system F family protein [Clostridia bacterium]
MIFVLIVVIAGFLSWGLFLFLEKGKKDEKSEEASLVKENSVGAETKNNTLVDYDLYVMSKKEWLFNFCLAAGFLFFVAYVFYRNIFLSLLVIPLAFFYPRLKTKEIIAKRKKELSLQFKEALYALSSSLMAGRSVESAFKESLKDLSLLYPDPQISIIQEFTYIMRRIAMNETIEEVLTDFAQRAHLEDLDSFVDVFVISKRTGGNIVEIIKNTSVIIGDKLQIEQEIDTILAQRKLEQKILNIMPIAMLLLLAWTTEDYMEPVFTTLEGRFIMTVAVLLLGLAAYLSKKIMTIEV